jgi:hypothetical protein
VASARPRPRLARSGNASSPCGEPAGESCLRCLRAILPQGRAGGAHEASAGGADVVAQLVGPEGARLDLPPARLGQRVERRHVEAPFQDQAPERARHLVRARGGSGRCLGQRLAPPLDAHLGQERLLGDVGRPRHLQVEGVEREERRARRRRRGHRHPEAVGVAPLDQPGAGLDRHEAAPVRAGAITGPAPRRGRASR